MKEEKKAKDLREQEIDEIVHDVRKEIWLERKRAEEHEHPH